MKTCFRISDKFPLEKELAREIILFCIAEAKPVAKKLSRKEPKQILFKLVNGGAAEIRSGRATRNTGRIVFSRVYLRLAKNHSPRWERYHRYKHLPDCPAVWISDSLEMFVHLAAHELGHAICGFEGDKVGEYQCERFAGRTLEKWRGIYREAACLI